MYLSGEVAPPRVFRGQAEGRAVLYSEVSDSAL